MRNLFRKSLRIIAGFGLLFLYNCATVTPSPSLVEKESCSLGDIFSKDMKTLVYLNRDENTTLIKSLSKSMGLDNNALSIINKSRELYIGLPEDVSEGMEVVVSGTFSKWKLEVGLFLSLDWKKIGRGGYTYWISKEGMSLYFVGDEHIILSSFGIIPLIKIFENSSLDPPTESILLLLPDMTSEQNSVLSRGFIKDGINDISISLDRISDKYELTGTLWLESGSKARGFSYLINIFLKLALSQSKDSEIVKISKEYEIEAINNTVLVRNITLNNKIIVDFVNSIIFIDGDTDK